MQQTPLEDVLDITFQAPGQCVVELPKSTSFGVVSLGGIPMSIAHKACLNFIATAPVFRSQHTHLLSASAHFFRPTLVAPKKTTVKAKLANTSRVWTTFHVEVSQDGGSCMVGYYTFTDFTIPGTMTGPTGWQLSPPPQPLSVPLRALETNPDADPDWICYKTPFHPKSFRNAHSYMKYYMPRTRPHKFIADTWIAPGWSDPKRPGGAVWTNELIHFPLDSPLPNWTSFVPEGKVPYGIWESTMAAGLEQRRLRGEGRSDEVFGRGLDATGMDGEARMDWIVSTVGMTVQIKKMLPEEGVKWLFIRAEVTQLTDDRTDHEIHLLDEGGDLVASSQHTMRVIPLVQKMAKKDDGKQEKGKL